MARVKRGTKRRARRKKLLKHAKGFHGADLLVADRLIKAGVCEDSEISPAPDNFAAVQPGKAIAPSMFMRFPRPVPHMVLAKSPSPSAESNAAFSNGETK